MSGYASGQHPASRANLTRTGRKPGARNRPKPLLDRVRTAAGRKSIAAVAVLAAIMQDTDQPGAVRVAAARAILDRGIGRPPVVDDSTGPARDDARRLTLSILGYSPEE